MTAIYRILISIVLCLFCGSHTVFAQSGKLQAIEDELISIQDTVSRVWNHIHNSQYEDDTIYSRYSDMMEQLCKQFESMLSRMLAEDKEMTYPFSKLQSDGLLGTSIVRSADSSLRVFSWMLPGGTLHVYGNTIQYKTGKQHAEIFSFSNEYNDLDYAENTGYEYDRVYTLIENDKTIYILSGMTLYSTRIAGCRLIAFGVENGKLVPENIFENRSNFTNEVSVNYEIGSNADSEPFLRPTIDENEKTLSLPLTESNCLTGKYLKYIFDKGKFRIASDERY